MITLKEIPDMSEIVELSIDEIRPNPYQQRKYFDFYSLNSLTESIKKFGVIQPIIVRVVNGRTYELVAGERRLRASRAAGLKTIPAVLVKADEEKSSLLSFIENIQRKELSYIEEAEGYRSLMEDFGMSLDEISEKTGASKSLISGRMKILELPDEALKMISENRLSEGHVRAALRLPDRDMRLKAISEMAERDMTVKSAEDYVERLMFDLRFGGGQKVKTGLGDIKIFTNSIRQTVDAVRKAGLTSYYDITDSGGSIDINIRVSCPEEK